MKKNTTIHVLPELKAHIPFEEFEEHLELAATIVFCFLVVPLFASLMALKRVLLE